VEDFLNKMAYKKRNQRDGTGPYKDSWQRENIGRGRRIEAGEECPMKETEETIEPVKIKEVKFFK